MKSCFGTGFWIILAFIGLVGLANKVYAGGSSSGTVGIFLLIVIGIPLVVVFLILRKVFLR